MTNRSALALPRTARFRLAALDTRIRNGSMKFPASSAALTHAQARVSVVWGAGSTESEKTISPVQAVIDNEIIGMVKKFLAGLPVNAETLALDEIRKVGICGQFLNSDHTLAHFRGAFFEPAVLVPVFVSPVVAFE